MLQRTPRAAAPGYGQASAPMQVEQGRRPGDVRVRRARTRKGWGLRDRVAAALWRVTAR